MDKIGRFTFKFVSFNKQRVLIKCINRNMSSIQSLLTPVSDPVESGGNKISVVGVGSVGMACAFALIAERFSTDIALVDFNEDKLKGEMLDLQHGAAFMGNVRVQASTKYDITAKSKVCIVTAGARQREGESRLSLVQRNTDILKSIIPKLVEYSPETILLIVTNPVDILTYVAWKLSGLPISRVIGSGTNLDSSRFKFLLSQKLNIAPSSCHGWIIGEHGDSSVAVWSGVNVAGVRLRDVYPEIGTDQDKEGWNNFHKQVVSSAYDVIKLKGYTSWAIALSVASICSSILRNTQSLFALSTLMKGYHCVDKEVFLSLPVVVGEKGITQIVTQKLTEEEELKLRKSANVMAEIQAGLSL